MLLCRVDFSYGGADGGKRKEGLIKNGDPQLNARIVVYAGKKEERRE
jgi:hypothetical protein